jgi:hypothetical protein
MDLQNLAYALTQVAHTFGAAAFLRTRKRSQTMKIYMLHFDCHTATQASRVTADACVIGENLEQAEAVARDAIAQRDYTAGDLIAYSQLDEAQVATLSDYETALYLKALQRKPRVAVVFS